MGMSLVRPEVTPVAEEVAFIYRAELAVRPSCLYRATSIRSLVDSLLLLKDQGLCPQNPPWAGDERREMEWARDTHTWQPVFVIS